MHFGKELAKASTDHNGEVSDKADSHSSWRFEVIEYQDLGPR